MLRVACASVEERSDGGEMGGGVEMDVIAKFVVKAHTFVVGDAEEISEWLVALIAICDERQQVLDDVEAENEWPRSCTTALSSSF